MRKKHLTITVSAALSLSLIAHGWLMYSMVDHEIRRLEREMVCGPIDVLDFLRRHHRMGISLKEALDEPDPPPVPVARVEMPDPEPVYREIFGQRGGVGKANENSPGDAPMQAQHADDDQAFLNHDPNADVTRPGEMTASTTDGKSPSAAGGGGGGGEGGEGGGGGLPSAAMSPQIAIVGLTPKDFENAPFGVPTPPPASLMPPAPLSKGHPMIALRSIAVIAPTTNRVEDQPINPTTQSVVTRENSPATRPTEIDPGSRYMNAKVAFATPSTQPYVDASTTQPSQIAIHPLTMTGPKGVLPTTQEIVAHLPTTLPLTPPEKPLARPDPIAIASIGDAPPHMETPSVGTSPGAPGRPGAPGTLGSSGGASAPAAPSGSEGGNKNEAESDPFTSEQSRNFMFVNGRVLAKDGRKVKSVRPKLSDSAVNFLIGSQGARVQLKLRIDATGKVADAEVVPGQSSGNAGLDLAVIKAALEFEFPDTPTDRHGVPQPDVQVIPFIFISN